jgi:hypothetical protein
MFVCCECCVLSGRGLCDRLITRPEESYRLWCVFVCDQETSKTRRLKPAIGLWKIQPQWVVTPGMLFLIWMIKKPNFSWYSSQRTVTFKFSAKCVSLITATGDHTLSLIESITLQFDWENHKSIGPDRNLVRLKYSILPKQSTIANHFFVVSIETC